MRYWPKARTLHLNGPFIRMSTLISLALWQNVIPPLSTISKPSRFVRSGQRLEGKDYVSPISDMFTCFISNGTSSGTTTGFDVDLD